MRAVGAFAGIGKVRFDFGSVDHRVWIAAHGISESRDASFRKVFNGDQT